MYNRGIAGDRIAGLYARIKKDIWNLNPDMVSILIGINDVWHEIGEKTVWILYDTKDFTV